MKNGKEKIKQLGSRLANSDGWIYEFLRSGVSSQAAAWVDLLLAFALFAWVGLYPWLSTAIGALVGGVINCVICYKFTFHAKGIPWKAVIVKYAMVWAGSALLNSAGTEGLYWVLKHWPWLEELGFKPDGYFAAARLFVSLVVSWGWNFLLQRNFVYRSLSYDYKFVNFVNIFLPRRFRGTVQGGN